MRLFGVARVKQALFTVFMVIGLFGMNLKAQSTKQKVEDFLLLNQLDSAEYYLNKLDSGNYKTVLGHFILNNGDEVVYSDFDHLMDNLRIRFSGADFETLYGFMKPRIEVPDTFNMRFVILEYVVINTLRNNGLFDLATQENNYLREHLTQFDSTKNEIATAWVYTQFHDLIMHIIQKERDQGIELATKMEQKARELNDTNLIIGALYHHVDFYMTRKTMGKYISMSETCWDLDKNRPTKSLYYAANFEHLISVYGFAGGYENKMWQICSELYNQLEYRKVAFNYHAMVLEKLEKKSPFVDSILIRYGKSSVPEMCMYMDSIATESLDPQSAMKQTDDIVAILNKHGFEKLAIKYAKRLIRSTREFYTGKMAKELSGYKTEKVKLAKQLEIEAEQEKSKLYSTAAIVVSLLLLLAIVGFYLSIKNGRALKKQKLEVEKQRNQIAERDKEKEVLLKEIHHRVKNNFQIVSSLLEMQTKDIEDEKAKELAIDGQNRVKSMSLIHQKLYQNNDLKVNIEEYIQKLIEELSLVYDAGDEVKVQLNAENRNFDIDTAIPLGLILNELITNAYKYGTQGEKKEIEVTLNQKNEALFELVVRDYGQGIPESIDLKKTKSIGLRLVRRLSKQLKGSLGYTYDNGACFTVGFKGK